MAALALFTLMLSFGASIAALYPGPGNLSAREYLEPLEPTIGVTRFAVPVFFDNGARQLTQGEKKAFQRMFSVFRSCERTSLVVRGFASSKKFEGYPKPQSDELNKGLANVRAVHIKMLLEDLLHIGGVQAHEWDTYDDMVRARRLRDTSLSDERLLDVETLNRRVEILWNDSGCLGALPARTATVPTPPAAGK